MTMQWMAVVAAVVTAVAVWVHIALTRYIRGSAVTARALLILTGLASAAVGYTINVANPGAAALSAVAGFGIVRVPSACILALKWWSARRA